MSLQQALDNLNVSEIVHFTTNHGCLGTLYTKKLQSRYRLRHDPMVEYIFAPNAKLRKDASYIDFVNLSIEHINYDFFSVSSNSWHKAEPIFWCILVFSPTICCDDKVMFATTNNMYTSVERSPGLDGFRDLYKPLIIQWPGKYVSRKKGIKASFPTCPQAEVLYPRAICTTHLRRIYVQTAADEFEIRGFLKATFHPDVDVIINPSKFGPRP